MIVINHTFEALVQTPRPLEQLVEVRPAVEHPLEGVVVRELQQERSPPTHTGKSHCLVAHPSRDTNLEIKLLY